MGKTFLRETTKLLQAKRRKKRWKKVVVPLSLIVILVTCSMLTYPAITMEVDTICGMNVHGHTQECYQRQLICGQEECEAVAEKNEKILGCQLAVHEHTDECLDENGQVICGQEEHVHGEGCWQTVYTPETAGHTHTEDCYQEVQICQIEEHTHSDACYSQSEMTATSEGTSETTSEVTLEATPEVTPEATPEAEVAVYTRAINYYLQEISDTVGFKLDHKDTYTADEPEWYTTSENYPELKGFTLIFESDEAADGTESKKDEESSEIIDCGKVEEYVLKEKVPTLEASHPVGTMALQDEEGYYIDLYYARNQYDMIFTSNDGNEDIEYKIADGTGIYYEADISHAAPSFYIKGETQKEEADGEIFVFDGWYENEECTSDEYSFDEKTMPAKKLHFYAKWTAYEPKLEIYSVRYLDMNGETIIQEDSNNYENQAEVTVLPMPETYTIPEGYEFVGWMDEHTQKLYAPDDVFVMEAEYTAAIEEKQYYILKAQYTELDKAYVQYDVNGGNGTLTDIGGENQENIKTDIPLNSSITLSKGEGFSKTGYKLLAWNTDANADGSDSYSATRYSLGDTYAVGDEESIILYAEWVLELNEPKKTSITISKTDEIGEPLSGAEFKLEKFENDTWVQVGDTLSIDINGLIVENLMNGTYRLTEIKAPEAYLLLDVPLLFEITDNEVLEINNGEYNYDEDLDMDYMEINGKTIMIRSVADPSYVVPQLPSTGGTGTFPYTLSGLLLVAVALMYGFVLQRRKKAAETRLK